MEVEQHSYDMELKKLEDDLEYAYGLLDVGINKDDIIYLAKAGYIAPGLEDGFGTTKTAIGEVFGLESAIAISGGIIAILVAAMAALVAWLLSKIFSGGNSDSGSSSAAAVAVAKDIKVRPTEAEYLAKHKELTASISAGDLESFSKVSGVHLDSLKNARYAACLELNTVLGMVTLTTKALSTYSPSNVTDILDVLLKQYTVPTGKFQDYIDSEEASITAKAIAPVPLAKLLMSAYKTLGHTATDELKSFEQYYSHGKNISKEYMSVPEHPIVTVDVAQAAYKDGSAKATSLNSELGKLTKDYSKDDNATQTEFLKGVVSEELQFRKLMYKIHVLDAVKFYKAALTKVILPYFVAVDAHKKVTTAADTKFYNTLSKGLRKQYINDPKVSGVDKAECLKWNGTGKNIPPEYMKWALKHTPVALAFEASTNIYPILNAYLKKNKAN